MTVIAKKLDIYQDEETLGLRLHSGFGDGWDFATLFSHDNLEIHVLPHGDLYEHLLTEECQCRPQMDDAGVWSHRSWDGRERYETHKERLS